MQYLQIYDCTPLQIIKALIVAATGDNSVARPTMKPLGFNAVCPGSSAPPEKKIFNIFASEIEVYTIY